VTSPFEAVGSTSIEPAPGAGLPAMAVLRGHVVLEGFGLRGSSGSEASAESPWAIARSRALRDATGPSTREWGRESGDSDRVLGRSNGSESAQPSSRLQRVGERYFAREISVRCASAGAEQRRGEPRGEPSARGVAEARRPILDEEGRGVAATRVSRGSEGRTNKIFPGVSRSTGTVESQSGRRRPGSGTPAHLTRATVKLVLARRKRFVA
jgi:hypothetical protein